VPIIDNDALSRSTKHISEFKHAGHVRIKVAPSSTAGFEAPGHSKEKDLLHIRKQEKRQRAKTGGLYKKKSDDVWMEIVEPRRCKL
jgi:hypothetical protein